MQNSSASRIGYRSVALRIVGTVLFIVLLSLQASLWGTRGILELWDLQRTNARYAADNSALQERNRKLRDELAYLKSNKSVLEELARESLGMVKPGETFFRIVAPKQATQDAP